MLDVKVIIPTLPVSDLARTHRYYVDVLGFVEPWGWGDPPQYGGVQAKPLEMPAFHFTVVPGDVVPGEAYVIVDDVDGLFARVKEAGADFVVEVDDRPYGMRDFMVTDPDGNKLSFGAHHANRG